MKHGPRVFMSELAFKEHMENAQYLFAYLKRKFPEDIEYCDVTELQEAQEQVKLLREALVFIEQRSFLVENVRCPYCDEGCESATCNCGQYDSYEEILECGKRARQAFAKLEGK